MERHSHGECGAKFLCSDYARGVLAEHTYEMCDFHISNSWQVRFEDDIVLRFPATELICVEVLWAVVLNAAAQEHKREVIVLRSQSPSFRGLISNLHCGQQVTCRQQQ